MKPVREKTLRAALQLVVPSAPRVTSLVRRVISILRRSWMSWSWAAARRGGPAQALPVELLCANAHSRLPQFLSS
ncbi:MAG TPA: hypothetical protein VKE72_09490, partial [Methylocella sp.]|nr:hypothetical protein [Methylocella sp.]